MAWYFSFLILNNLFFSDLSPKKQTIETTIHFPEFSLRIQDYEVEPELQELLKTNSKSTLSISSIPGETPESKQIQIISSQAEDFKLSYFYETGIFVTAEEVNCNLSYWKHFTAKEMPLKTLQANHFLYPTLTEAEQSQFIEVDLEAFKKEVKQNCGEPFYKAVKRNQKIKEGVAQVVLYRHALRISGKLKTSHKTFSKLVFFELGFD